MPCPARLVLPLLLAACTTSPEPTIEPLPAPAAAARPDPPRDQLVQGRPLRAPYTGLDLPFYGGKLEQSDVGFLRIDYRDEQTLDQLKERWPQALVDLGWTEVERTAATRTRLEVAYRSPDGLDHTLTIRGGHSLSMVTLRSREAVRAYVEELDQAAEEPDPG